MVKRKFTLSFLLLLACIFCFTFGQSIPVYFVDTSTRTFFYFMLCMIAVVSAGWIVFQRIYRSRKEKFVKATVISIVTAGLTLLVFGVLTLGLMFSAWSEASTYYVKKDNPNIKIVSCYANEGAYGGGTKKKGYKIVLSRPFLYFFKLETAIDTATIDKNEWTTPKLKFGQSR